MLHDAPQQRIPVSDARGKTARQTGQAETAALRPADFDESIPKRKRQPKETPFPARQGTKSEHDFGHHHERVHILLVPVLCASSRAAVSR